MSSLKSILKELFLKEKEPPRFNLPEKVTHYGLPSDNFTKIVETFAQDEDGNVHVTQSIQYKALIDYISMSMKI